MQTAQKKHREKVRAFQRKMQAEHPEQVEGANVS